MQRQKIELEVGSKCPCMFSRHWCDIKYIWHTPDRTHWQTQSPRLRGNERSAILDFFFQWTRRKLPQKQKWWALWGWILTSSVCCWELTVGTLVRQGFCIYKQKFQEPWRSWSVSKCPFCQAEWEALANGMPYTQRRKSLKVGHSTQLSCLHRRHSEFTGSNSKCSRGRAQAVQCFKWTISRKEAPSPKGESYLIK